MKQLKLALLVLMCVITAACAAKQPQESTTSGVTTEASTEWRIKSLEESFLNFREEQRLQGDKARENKIVMDQRLTAIELEIAALKAAAMSGTTDTSETPGDMVDESPADGDELKADPGDEGWVDGQKSDEQPMAQSSEEKPWDQVPGSAATSNMEAEKKAAALKKSTPKKGATSSAQRAYDTALALYNTEKYNESRAAFEGFTAKYPKSDLVPNALYWKGETYYSQKDFAQAILSFKEVTGRYPKHAKAAAALLKIGMSYDKVGDSDNAIFYLRALVEDFPKSDPAKMARKELKRLGG